MRISIFGLGYVGAVSCACLPELGHEVIGVDTNPTKVRMINDGPVAGRRGRHRRADRGAVRGQAARDGDVGAAVLDSEISLISVATPLEPELHAQPRRGRRGDPLDRRGRFAQAGHHTIVLRSTVPPGTTEDRILPILEEAAGRKVGDRLSLVFNPEFLREGSSVKDFHGPPQTVIGSLDEARRRRRSNTSTRLPGRRRAHRPAASPSR